MMEDIIKDAKTQFLKDYRPQIDNIGYALSVGLGWYSEDSKNFDTLQIRIQSETDIPPQIKMRIERMIPEKYEFKGEKIPIKILYSTKPKME